MTLKSRLGKCGPGDTKPVVCRMKEARENTAFRNKQLNAETTHFFKMTRPRAPEHSALSILHRFLMAVQGQPPDRAFGSGAVDPTTGQHFLRLPQTLLWS